MSSVIIYKSAINALNLLRSRESLSGKVSNFDVIKAPVISSDPRTIRAISPAIADVLLSLSDSKSNLNKARATPALEKPLASNSSTRHEVGQSREKSVSISGVSLKDIERIWFLLADIRSGTVSDMKEISSKVPSYLLEQIRRYSIEDLSGDVRIRVDDKSIIEGAKENILGIAHYHYDDKKAQDWMERHFGRSGEMNCDPDDPCVRAVLNGTAKIIRGTDMPEVGLWSRKDKIYGIDSVSKSSVVVGTSASGGIGENFIDMFEKTNPGYGVRPVYIFQDVALVIYAKS